jgi:hypothetical protein
VSLYLPCAYACACANVLPFSLVLFLYHWAGVSVRARWMPGPRSLQWASYLRKAPISALITPAFTHSNPAPLAGHANGEEGYRAHGVE